MGLIIDDYLMNADVDNDHSYITTKGNGQFRSIINHDTSTRLWQGMISKRWWLLPLEEIVGVMSTIVSNWINQGIVVCYHHRHHYKSPTTPESTPAFCLVEMVPVLYNIGMSEECPHNQVVNFIVKTVSSLTTTTTEILSGWWGHWTNELCSFG